jgi:hypothetical protein
MGMFGRRRKADKMPADLILAATSTTIDASTLAQLQSRSHGLTPAHKARKAHVLTNPPTDVNLVLAQAAPGRQIKLASADASGSLGGSLLEFPDGDDDDGGDDDASLMRRVEEIFQERGWKYVALDGGALLINVEGVPMLIEAEERRQILRLEVPLVAGRGSEGYVMVRPAAERNAAMFLMSVNYRLSMGAFTRDHADGEIRFETNLPLMGSTLSGEQMATIMIGAAVAVRGVGPILLALLQERVTLKQALSGLEGPSRGNSDIKIA